MTVEIEEILQRKQELNTSDFFSIYPGVPPQTVYSRIRRLIKSGDLEVIGDGLYRQGQSMERRYDFSQHLLDVHQTMIDEQEGLGFCISEKNGNVLLEVPNFSVENVLSILSSKGENVFRESEVKQIMSRVSGLTIVRALVSEAPLVIYSGIPVPSVEKSLVDLTVEGGDDIVLHKEYQHIFETYPVNQNKMLRYASRRNRRPEVQVLIDGVSVRRIAMFADIRKYFRSIPVEKAWVFGSFARCEETDSSDLDILVQYSQEESLIKRIRYRLDIEKISGREVDLVECGQLMPSAEISASKDKYLIYEK